MGEQLWQMHERHQRGHIFIRLDAGLGSDPNVHWLLQRGYQVLRKGKSGKRAAAFARQVEQWQPLNESKWIALAPLHLCHRSYRRTQPVMLRWYNPRRDQFKHALLICS
jgi:hypothetical protein